MCDAFGAAAAVVVVSFVAMYLLFVSLLLLLLLLRCRQKIYDENTYIHVRRPSCCDGPHSKTAAAAEISASNRKNISFKNFHFFCLFSLCPIGK